MLHSISEENEEMEEEQEDVVDKKDLDSAEASIKKEL